MARATSVTVIGAGAFGGWTALELLRAGARVTLIDAWGPGHSRSSSGDESRVIRGAYGPNAVYTEMVARAIPKWLENERRWGIKLLHQNGALWIANPAGDAYERAALQHIANAGMPCEQVDAAEGRRRWPQMNWDGLTWAVYEKDAGYLLARRACQAVMEAFVAEGGIWRVEAVEPPDLELPLNHSRLASTAPADHYVFACGPWLGALFPNVLGRLITPTRQELFYLGTPAGDQSFDDSRFPTWVDNGAPGGGRFYGIPGNPWRGGGFKIAKDEPGERLDPTFADRRPASPSAALAEARAYLARRFPALRNAPVVETRVCQYEMTPDGHLIVDRHPAAPNVWLVGGGSGHGFKLGPALGEMVAAMVLSGDGRPPRPEFALARFAGMDLSKQPLVGERK